jgi:hypothetical protein
MFSPADNFGVYDLLPEMGGFLGDIRFYLCLFLLLVPVIMVIMGALRFFRPAAEANHSVGYRTFFGMGSVYAWRVTQWVSGVVFLGVGGLLLLLAIIQCFVMGGKEVGDAVTNMYTWLIVEGVGLLLSIVAVEVVIGLQFDKNGNLRPGRKFFFLSYVPYRQPKVVEVKEEPVQEVPEEPEEEEPQLSDQDLFTQENFFDFDALLANDSVPTENPKNKE